MGKEGLDPFLERPGERHPPMAGDTRSGRHACGAIFTIDGIILVDGTIREIYLSLS